MHFFLFKGYSLNFQQLGPNGASGPSKQHVSHHGYSADRRPYGSKVHCSEQVISAIVLRELDSNETSLATTLAQSLHPVFIYFHTVLISSFLRTLTVKNPARDEVASEWLKDKIRTELWALVQHGNPQEIIPYSIALTSKLNQVRCLVFMFHRPSLK